MNQAKLHMSLVVKSNNSFKGENLMKTTLHVIIIGLSLKAMASLK